MTNQLPPLPEPVWGYSTNTPKFSTEQMRDYARSALAQQPAQPVAWISPDYFTAFSRQGFTVATHKIAPGLVPLYAAPQQAAPDEPDMRHPKIQRLIGAKARISIELQLVEQLLDDPDCELTSMDMEYWNGMHDKLREKLTAAQQSAQPRSPI